MARRWAVLIDADNVGAKCADPLFHCIADMGDVIVRRVYGDFERKHGQWKKKAEKHFIEIKQLSNLVKGKNGADIALVIDAMRLSFRGSVNAFCLVTSDSDFTHLADHLRDDGCVVLGIGKARTAKVFQKACSKFIALEELKRCESVAVVELPAPPHECPNAHASPITRVVKSCPRDEAELLEMVWAALPHGKESHPLREFGSILKRMCLECKEMPHWASASPRSFLGRSEEFQTGKSETGGYVVTRRT